MPIGLGMCVVDAYLAFRIDYLALNKMQCFVTFACGLAYSLIFNIYYDES